MEAGIVYLACPYTPKNVILPFWIEKSQGSYIVLIDTEDGPEMATEEVFENIGDAYDCRIELEDAYLTGLKTRRFLEATKACAELTSLGLAVFSPITHSHPMAVHCGMNGLWKFWESIDKTFLRACKAIFVLTIDGWDISDGVTEEIRYAKEELGLPIIYISAGEDATNGNNTRPGSSDKVSD